MPPSCAEPPNRAIQREDRERRLSSRKRSFRRSCVNRPFSIISADPPFLALAGVSIEIAAGANILAINSTMWRRTPYSRSFCSARAHSFSQPVSCWALSPFFLLYTLLRSTTDSWVHRCRVVAAAANLWWWLPRRALENHEYKAHVCGLHRAELTAAGLRDCRTAGPDGARTPAGFSSVGPSSSFFFHRTSPNLVLRTVNALIAPCPEYMVPAAIFNLRKANTPQTNAVSTLKWATGWFTIQFIELVLLREPCQRAKTESAKIRVSVSALSDGRPPAL